MLVVRIVWRRSLQRAHAADYFSGWISRSETYSPVQYRTIYLTRLLGYAVGSVQSNKMWEVEIIHHQLNLENTTSEIQKFNISHGSNLIMLNRDSGKKMFRYRFGTGMVLTHPESNIRGKVFGHSNDDKDLGYYLSVPALNLAVGKDFRISNSFYFDVESKATCVYTRIKVANGHADVYH